MKVMDVSTDNGVAMIIAVMTMLVMTALGAAIVLTTTAETLIATGFRSSQQALYAADAALARAVDELSRTADWNAVLAGAIRSAFVDGPPAGVRALGDGSRVDLDRVVSLADCGKPLCSIGDLTATTIGRPWGANNPRWQLYAHGRLVDMLPGGAIDSAFYVLVLVADDASENDGDPLRDGASTSNPGSGIIGLRGHAFGPRGAHRAIEMTIQRAAEAEAVPGPMRVLSWREAR